MTPTAALKASLTGWVRSRILSIDGRRSGDFDRGRADALFEVIDLVNSLADPTEDPLFGVKSFRDLTGDDSSDRIVPVVEPEPVEASVQLEVAENVGKRTEDIF